MAVVDVAAAPAPGDRPAPHGASVARGVALMSLLAVVGMLTGEAQRRWPAPPAAAQPICRAYSEESWAPPDRAAARAGRLPLWAGRQQRPRLRCLAEGSSLGGGRRQMDRSGRLWQFPGGMRPAWRLLLGLGLDLNQVIAADLCLLQGIGPKLAAAVVAHRQQHGRFQSVAQIAAVRGIGPQRAALLRPFLSVTPAAAPQVLSPDGALH